MTEAGLIAARFAHYAALVLAFGAFAYAGFGERSPLANTRLRRLKLGASLALLPAALAVLAATAAGLGGGFGALGDPALWSAILTGTDFGRVWSARLVMAALLIAFALSVWRRPRQRQGRLGLLLAGGLVVTVALTGHAQAGQGAPGMVHRFADAAHLIAAAVWLGALPPLLVLLRGGGGRSVEEMELAADRLRAFHAIGLSAVLTLILTGLVSSWFLVGDVERLVATTYGRVLLAKLALFLGMLGIAAANRLHLVPALSRELARGSDPGWALPRLRSYIAVELFLGTLVLLAVAVLGAIEPASA